jgi:hypothetical protein
VPQLVGAIDAASQDNKTSFRHVAEATSLLILDRIMIFPSDYWQKARPWTLLHCAAIASSGSVARGGTLYKGENKFA